MRSSGQVWNGIKSFFLDFQWPYAVGAVFFVVIIYYVLRTLAENNAKKIIPIYLLLIVFAGTFTLFTDIGATMFIIVTLLLSVFFLLLFSTEIKRSVWKKHKNVVTEHKQASKVTGTVRTVRAEEHITNIVKAVQSLSKANIGALIVLSNGNLPREIIESGVILNSSISSQLIEGIFFPKAPLHDGAMIITADKIQAAGCFLPLTQKEFPKNYGTRHRAGIGITEVADVSAIIVSEETGIVSTVKRGEITRFVDSEALKRFLREYYWKDFNGEVRQK